MGHLTAMVRGPSMPSIPTPLLHGRLLCNSFAGHEKVPTTPPLLTHTDLAAADTPDQLPAPPAGVSTAEQPAPDDETMNQARRSSSPGVRRPLARVHDISVPIVYTGVTFNDKEWVAKFKLQDGQRRGAGGGWAGGVGEGGDG